MDITEANALIAAAPANASIILTGIEPGGALKVVGKQGLKLTGDARFRTLEIVSCKGLDVSRIAVDFVPDAKTSNSTNAIRISSSDGTTLHDMQINGLPAPEGIGYLPEGSPVANGPIVGRPNGRALVVENACTNTVIEYNNITGFFCGPCISGNDGTNIRFNKIVSLRTTGIRGGGQNITLEGNQIIGDAPYRFLGANGVMTGDHSDFDHIWNNPGDVPTRGLKIINNYFDDAGGASPSVINVEDKGPGIDCFVSGNLAVSSNTQGITLGVKVTGTFTNNDFIGPVGCATPPTLIERTSTGIVVTGNTLHDSSTKPYNSTQFPNNVWRPRFGQTQAEVDDVRARGLAMTASAGVRPLPVDPNIAIIADLKAEVNAARADAANSDASRKALEAWMFAVIAVVSTPPVGV